MCLDLIVLLALQSAYSIEGNSSLFLTVWPSDIGVTYKCNHLGHSLNAWACDLNREHAVPRSSISAHLNNYHSLRCPLGTCMGLLLRGIFKNYFYYYFYARRELSFSYSSMRYDFFIDFFFKYKKISYRRRLRSLLYWCYVFRALIKSLVCWFYELQVFCVSRRQYLSNFTVPPQWLIITKKQTLKNNKNSSLCFLLLQCCFTSTKTVRTNRTRSPGRLPRLSHSSRAVKLSVVMCYTLM